MIDIFFLAGRMTMLARRLSLPLRIIAVLSLLASTDVAGQNCDCPPAATCKTCSGGYTSLTLRYNGLLNGIVTVFDGGGQIKATTVSKGDEFWFLGSIPNEKFQGSLVTVYFDGLPSGTFYTTCTNQYPGTVSGLFTIVSLVSKDGGPVCCLSAAVDDKKPEISNCPSNKVVNLTSSCATTVNWTEPTVTDDCNVTMTSTHQPNLSSFVAGTTTQVTYTAVDTYGNQETCKFNVTVNDVGKPTITCPSNIPPLTADANCEAKFTLPSPTVTDNCSGTAWIHNHPSEIFTIGTKTVTYTATDASGNKSSCICNVIVEDKTKPFFVSCPADTSVTVVDNSCVVKVKWIEPKATDNCSDPKLTASHNNDYAFPFGSTKVEYTAIDEAGNSATCSFIVTVNNPTGPMIDGCPPSTITANATEKSDSTIVTWVEPTATVQCDTVIVERSHAPGSKFPIGITPVNYTFTDATGKWSICEFDVQVFAPDELFAISKVVTPDGDGINDVWELSNIENFTSNTVVVIDRWGNKIYQATGYDNVRTVWRGTNNSGTIVPTGTYFYTIEIRDQGKVVLKKGFIEVIQ